MIKYPTTKKTYRKPRINQSNRGMGLEKLIDETNAYYIEHGKALIHKKPTPVQIVNVDYPRREMAKITEAYFRKPSTTDYNGVYKGLYIDFDVKETKHKTSYALKNIHDHQIRHLRGVKAHGGVAFILLKVETLNTVFLLPFERIETYLKRAEKGRKSMTIAEIEKEGYPIQESVSPRLDYLSAVDRYLKDMNKR